MYKRAGWPTAVTSKTTVVITNPQQYPVKQTMSNHQTKKYLMWLPTNECCDKVRLPLYTSNSIETVSKAY